GVWTDVELTGLEAVWINFRKQLAPSTPNLVEPLPEVAQPLVGEQAPKPADHEPCHYLYVGGGLSKVEDLIALLHYTAQTQPKVGANLEEAMKADQVTIVGSRAEVSEKVEQQLRML